MTAGRFRVEDFAGYKRRGMPIVMATAYDFPSAGALSDAGVDVALVGDSAAMTILGLPATREVTVDEMLMLTRAVRRGLAGPLLLGDLPFGTYEESDEQAVATARRFAGIGCDAVKLEGGGPMVSRAAAVVRAGIPVVGHVGLTPQKLRAGDAARVEARSADAARQLYEDARALEAAGCVALIFEAVPAPVSEAVVPRLGIPVIGIGAGGATDGQVLVTSDLLGLTRGHVPKFVKQYARIGAEMDTALSHFADDVRARRFPAAEHEYGMSAAEVARLEELLKSV